MGFASLLSLLVLALLLQVGCGHEVFVPFYMLLSGSILMGFRPWHSPYYYCPVSQAVCGLMGWAPWTLLYFAVFSSCFVPCFWHKTLCLLLTYCAAPLVWLGLDFLVCVGCWVCCLLFQDGVSLDVTCLWLRFYVGSLALAGRDPSRVWVVLPSWLLCCPSLLLVF